MISFRWDGAVRRGEIQVSDLSFLPSSHGCGSIVVLFFVSGIGEASRADLVQVRSTILRRCQVRKLGARPS